MGVIMGLVSALLLGLTGLAAAGVVFAVNAGGGTYTSAAGLVYQADVHFVGGAPDNATDTSQIVGTVDDPLYQTWRWTSTTQLRYAIPISNGDYQVTLKFAENVHNQAGRRRFEVHLEGVQVLPALDVWTAAGGQHRAYDVILPVTVIDGQLDLAFVKAVGNPMIGAIVVTSAVMPPPPGAGAVTLSWDAVPGAIGYRLYASTDLGATWTLVADVATTTATVAAGASGLTLYRAGAYTASGETIRMHAGAWANPSWQPLGQPIVGMP